MASNKLFVAGPIALTTTLTTNILNPGTTTGGVASTSAPFDKLQITIKHIRVTNKHASVAATFNLFIGATGGNSAGTEIAFTQAVAVGASVDIYFPAGRVLTTSDFLVGGSNTATALTIMIMGEIGVA